eukprot:COSAG01_NODE_11052_length_2019_cov_28.741146_1_plen_64_part_00
MALRKINCLHIAYTNPQQHVAGSVPFFLCSRMLERDLHPCKLALSNHLHSHLARLFFYLFTTH